MNRQPVSLAAAFSTFDDLWSPRIVTSVNDYEVRVAKANGEHVWHTITLTSSSSSSTVNW